MNQQLQERTDDIDEAMHVAQMEVSLGLSEWLNVKVNFPFKTAVRIVASILHTSASQIMREAVFDWMEDHYPDFLKIYYKELTKSYSRKLKD